MQPHTFYFLLFLLKLFTYKPKYFYFSIYSVTIFYNINFLFKKKNKAKNKLVFIQKKQKKNYIYNVKLVIYSIDSSINNALATNHSFKRKRTYKPHHKLVINNYGWLKKFFKKKILKKKTKLFKVFSSPKISLVKKRYKAFTLKQRHFIVKKILIRRVFSFLIKHSVGVSSFLKYKLFKKKKVFLVNMYKKLAWKMHKSRVIHWNFATKGQLNKYRYNKLLANCLNFLKKNSSITFLVFLLFSIYSYSSSWRQILILLQKNVIVYNGSFIYNNTNLKVGDIIELPFGAQLKKTIFNNTNKHLKKLKKATYKFFKKKNKKNKKIPKIYKKTIFKVKITKNFIAYDPVLNIIAIIKKVPTFDYNLKKELLKSSVIGLQNWRYEFQ